MQVDEIYRFLQTSKLAVVSSIGTDGEPQSALVGIAVSPHLEVIFDTVASSRKYRNLKTDARISLVAGWEGETTVQYEGHARELAGEDLDRAKQMYFQVWPECIPHQQWPDIAYFLLTPRWVR